jgi:5-methyltetrahydrofolate--homocysteine methyltransferase
MRQSGYSSRDFCSIGATTAPWDVPMNRRERLAALHAALDTRVLVLDGAMGTTLQGLDLQAADFGGPEYEGCNEHLVLTRPAVIKKVHADYLAAGADIVETDTFGATPLVLGEYGLTEKAHEINRLAARLAREAADEASTPERPRWVAGSIGPTTKSITVTGGVTFDELVAQFAAQARGLHEGGADYFLIETCQDTRNIKAAILGVQQVNAQTGEPLPIAVSGTIEPMGTMLAGQSVEALATSLEHVELLYLGLNCATGPDFMTDHIRSLSGLARTRIACVPNAGLPDENGHYLESPEMLGRVLDRFAKEGWLNLVGGCCGTHAGHIAELARLARAMPVRKVPTERRSTLSGIEHLEITDDRRPVLVGERTNVIGSKKFKDLIIAGQFDDASEIARAQVKNAAQVVDVCLANPDRDELADTTRFLEKVIHKVKAPLMIDSTDARVIHEALKYSQGKAIINSINLEDGEERYEQVVPLAKQFGAALVVGCIDEDEVQGMGVTRARKLAIAERSHALLTGKYGVAEEDIYFDPLVFPCATGDAQYVGSAVETIEGVRLIKQRFPRARTVLGISNVSFGLPAAGREVLNSVFLYHCVQAGLDLAIVNSEKLERYATLGDEEKKLCEDLLWNRGEDPVAAFAAHFRTRVKTKTAAAQLPLDERLARYVIEGAREGLIADLDEALKERRPLEVINGPLMKGMDEVGRLFNKNELIVAEVLQSAEVMKLAVSHLEKFMEKNEDAGRGKVLLATVKGDVHDIGKNLVDIILSNNGFNVVNLGIKVPPEQLIAAIRQHNPDIIGLSGLLVKSAQQMVITAGDLTTAGIETPMLVGGAALTRNFVDRQISAKYAGTVAYAQDAMNGLELAKQIVDPERFASLKSQLKAQRARLRAETEAAAHAPAEPSQRRSSEVELLATVPAPPDFERHVLTNTPPDHAWKFINPVMLYGRHLGLKGSIVRTLETTDRAILACSEQGRKALELLEAVDALKDECRAGAMKIRAVYQFFRAESEGNTLHLFDADGRPATSFTLPRQARENGLCLADYVSPKGGPADSVALFVVTAGEGIRARAEEYKRRGEFLMSHALQALALETAEAYAELLHARLRNMWGFPDDPSMTNLDRFKANYQGKRFSFGYPACPRLEDQEGLFAALNPREIGVQLTDGCMMEPEASVSALVFHHPQASYFSVTDLGAARAGLAEDA